MVGLPVIVNAIAKDLSAETKGYPYVSGPVNSATTAKAVLTENEADNKMMRMCLLNIFYPSEKKCYKRPISRGLWLL